jgi:protein TonB
MASILRVIAFSAVMATSFVSGAAAQETAPTTMPVLVKDVKPMYTREAREARIQGVVGLDAVVLKDGTVGDVAVTKSLDKEHGLDDQAVKAMKQWQFKPGTKDGKPVDVRISAEMSFTLKSRQAAKKAVGFLSDPPNRE